MELSRTETRLHNFIEFIASGRATPSITNAIETEEKKSKLYQDIQGLESANSQAFDPPPVEWIEHFLTNLKQLLNERTEKSAIVLRQLTGPITLKPKKPEVGREYY
jgi:hypothetical protein